MAAEASRSTPSPDSYIGSLITLTSKSEIRYEGILYNINTEESSIGLRNVRSFGTEGRKKDGSQVPASDKIYEYILFRGSDIKDLQVKASPPVQTAPVHNDPAIIQSHYPRPSASSVLPSSLPPLGTAATPELTSHAGQVGLQRPTFQGSFPPYPSGGNFGPWGPALPPPAANGSGLAAPPMFWQGYYGPSTNLGGLPHLPQPPLMRPLPGLAMPPMQQTMQFQGMNVNAPMSSGPPSYPEFSSLLPTVGSSLTLTSASLPSTLAPIHSMPLFSEMSQSSVSVKGPLSSLPSVIPSGNFPSMPPLTTGIENITHLPQNIPPVINSKPRTGPITPSVHQTEIHSNPSGLSSSSSKQAETSVKLVTPGQLVQPNQSGLPSTHSLEKPTLKDVEVKLPEDNSKPLLPEPSVTEREAKAKAPILPLPTAAHHKPNGITFPRENNRGRGRGRGSVYPRMQNQFAEDFDFMAMNEKFNKDEVWGHLGKGRPHDEDVEADGFEEDGDYPVEFGTKHVYVKDDFFDTLSCNANNQTNNGRIKFSEQLKIDTETFGNFPRNRPAYRGGRGVRGGRGRGSYYGRGYGYSGRGRGQAGPSRPS